MLIKVLKRFIWRSINYNIIVWGGVICNKIIVVFFIINIIVIVIVVLVL